MNRKDEHIAIAMNQKTKPNAFDRICLESNDLSGLKLSDIDLRTSFLGYKIPYPIYVNAMTGGTDKAYEINKYLAKLAQYFDIPMISGSQSIALKDESKKESFEVIRKYHHGILLANINPNYGLKDAKRAINMIQANGLSIHLNTIQELIMPEGDRDFSMWKENIDEINQNLDLPLLVKHVGIGMSQKTIEILKSIGIKYIDVSGSGGTSFIDIESTRANKNYDYLKDFEIDTATILLDLINEKELEIYASGGIRNPLDVIKALVLGAKAVGLSKWFLDLTKLPFEESIKAVEDFILVLKKIMIIIGAKNISELKNVRFEVNL